MANTTAYVTAAKPGVGGAIWTAPIGTPLPTSASAPLDDAFESMGYLSDEGLTHGINWSTSQTRAWGGDVVLNSQTEKDHTYSFSALEALNTVVLAAVYGAKNVSGTLETGVTVRLNADEVNEKSWVFDEILRNGILKRTVIARGGITTIAEINDNDTDPIAYNITLQAMPDPELNGDGAQELYLDPSQAAAGVELNASELTVPVGGTAVLRAQAIPGSAAVTWTSSATGKATVVGSKVDGKNVAIVSGVSAGTATITASITSGVTTETATCTVTVAEV